MFEVGEGSNPLPHFFGCLSMGKHKKCRKAYLQAYYQANKEKYDARSAAWRKANLERAREIVNKSGGAYYHKVTSPLAKRACRIFERLNEERRHKFAVAIMNDFSIKWSRAKCQYALDEWLGAYSGI